MKCAFLDAKTHKHRRQCQVSLNWRAPLKKIPFSMYIARIVSIIDGLIS